MTFNCIVIKTSTILNKHLLNKYFKNQCSQSEKETVENWILNQDNKSTFENYIQEEWHDFELTTKGSKSSISFARNKSKVWTIAASVIAIISIGTYYFANTNLSIVEKNNLTAANSSTLDEPSLNKIKDLDEKEQMLTANNNKLALQEENIKPVIKKVETNSAKVESKPKVVSTAKIGHLGFNEKLLSELSSQIDSNKLVLTMNMKEERFKEVAELLKSRYQIILEPVKIGDDKNLYAARFEKTNIQDLLRLIEEKTAFTFKLKDSLLHINL